MKNQISSTHLQHTISSDERTKTGPWHVPATITANNFVAKSLSNFAFNPAVGCTHACPFCYVPNASTIKLGRHLAALLGVNDPDAEWGDYVAVRPWDERKFTASLRRADNTPASELKPDGHRAVMFSSTTDPFQWIRNRDVATARALNRQFGYNVARAFELIRDKSQLRVRVLTRSPLSRNSFDELAAFGPRATFGMSLPTLRNDLAKIYEPRAPAPSQRLATLKAAKEAGLHVYVAIAPTYPECDEEDLHATLKAVAELEPVTIFHEPINVRAENVARIARRARRLGVTLRSEVFDTREAWAQYAFHALRNVHVIANDLGVANRLHLWPDKALGSRAIVKSMSNPNQ